MDTSTAITDEIDAPTAVESATLTALKLAAERMEGSTALANAMLSAATGDRPARWVIELAGEWLDGLLAELRLPAALQPRLDSLRLTLIKAALSDPIAFFTAGHPVSAALDAWLVKAMWAGLLDEDLAAAHAALQELATNIAVQNAFVEQALPRVAKVPDGLVASFQQLCAQLRDSRRDRLSLKASGWLRQELEIQTLDVSVPGTARDALTNVFQPLQLKLLLDFGLASTASRRAWQLLDDFMQSFASADALARHGALLTALGECFAAARMPAFDSDLLAAALQQAREECSFTVLPVDAKTAVSCESFDPPGLSAPLELLMPLRSTDMADDLVLQPLQALADLGAVSAAADSSEVLLKVGHWYRLRDYKRGQDRWLALVAHERALGRLSFAGFDGAIMLGMRESQFLEDLASGIAEPLEPDAQIQQALQALRRQSAKPEPIAASFQ